MSHLLSFVQRSKARLKASKEIVGTIGGQPLSESFGRQQCRRYADFLKRYPNRVIDNLGTSNGLTLYHLADGIDRVFALFDGQVVVAYGKLEPSPYSKRQRMYNLYVAKDYRGKKLATVLHLGALHVYKHLESDTTMALGAFLAFKSLERYGYKLKMLDTEQGMRVPFKWGADGIPTVDGHSIENAENYALYV